VRTDATVPPRSRSRRRRPVHAAPAGRGCWALLLGRDDGFLACRHVGAAEHCSSSCQRTDDPRYEAPEVDANISDESEHGKHDHSYLLISRSYHATASMMHSYCQCAAINSMQCTAACFPTQLTLCGAAQFLMACNNTGPFTTEFAAKWGIADFDWSNWVHGANQTWDGEQYGGYSEQVPETCQQNLRVQAAMTKAANNNTKVFVYRNMVKALPWYKSVREKLVDPAYSGFFLPFKCNASASDPNVIPGEDGCHVPRQGTALYHDQEQTIHGKTCPTNGTGSQACCGVPCGECRRSQRRCSKIVILDCLWSSWRLSWKWRLHDDQPTHGNDYRGQQ
jgi:hypothetical protein